VCDEIPDQVEDIPVGVGQVPDENGQFRYLCGIEVKRLGHIPSGLEAMKIEPARYAVFEHDDHVSGLYDTYRRVWNEALPAAELVAADAPIIERHNPSFNPATGEGGLTLWVPLAERDPAGDPDEEVARSRNRETIASYSRYAKRYAEVTATMSADTRDLLRRFAEALPKPARILEIGSGPGWDADYLEDLGIVVRRTDATPGFVDVQRERGKSAERLDLIGDPLGGPYDGVLVLYVLQHIDAPLLDNALAKLAACLRPGGYILLTYRQGDGTLTEHGMASGDYHSTLRRPGDFRALLQRVGLAPEWERELVDDDGTWQVVLARAGQPRK
jgi:predicted transcriptional regulator YdeE